MIEPLMLPAEGYRIGTYAGNIWANVLVVGIILWDWRRTWPRRAGFEAHALRAAMLLFPVFWGSFWITQSIRPFSVTSMTFGVHELEFQHGDIAWLVLSLTIMTLLLRRLAADRREAQRLTGELQAARTIQDLLISKSSPGTPTLPVEAAYHPAFEVGGDFFQILPTEDGGLLIAVGDVSGKGLRAAMVVSLLAGALRNRKAGRPGALLGELNRVAAEALDGGFVTATIARCDPDGRVTIASAGHPAPYLSGEEVMIEPGLPLGIDLSAEYGDCEFVFEAGRQLTFVSDGVMEAANVNGELFGFQRTAEASARSAREIADAARAWGQNDDVTVVTVRRNLECA
jgi:serine phosphatase RsbU (regulator of sigma subunit)